MRQQANEASGLPRARLSLSRGRSGPRQQAIQRRQLQVSCSKVHHPQPSPPLVLCPVRLRPGTTDRGGWSRPRPPYLRVQNEQSSSLPVDILISPSRRQGSIRLQCHFRDTQTRIAHACQAKRDICPPGAAHMPPSPIHSPSRAHFTIATHLSCTSQPYCNRCCGTIYHLPLLYRYI